jgi:antitoxin HicB
VEHQFFAFPAHFEPNLIDGGFVITFRDVPEAITQADTYAQGLSEASDCLVEAIANFRARFQE